MTVIDLTRYLPEREPAWQEYAVCAQTDPEAFFPEKGESPRSARAVCGGCQVRNLCLVDAFAFEDETSCTSFGVWGGTTADERRKMTAQQRRHVAAAAQGELAALQIPDTVMLEAA